MAFRDYRGSPSGLRQSRFARADLALYITPVGKARGRMKTVHVIGAGMAGLSCAVTLAKAGERVVLWEAAGQAGGRCRSFFDETLGRRIDNGNHLILGANPAVFAYLHMVGAPDGLLGQARASIPFVDLRTDARWMLRPNAGPVPWWIAVASRRVPGSRPWHYLSGALALARAGAGDTVAQRLRHTGPLMERLWEPLTAAVLNAAPDEAAASLLWPVLRLTFGRGEAACRAFVAREGLGPDLVDPAVRYIESRGGTLHFNRRVRALRCDGAHAAALGFTDGETVLNAGDAAVLAVPPRVCVQLLPEVRAPLETRPIVNAHFRLTGPVPMPGRSAILGVTGGTAQWIFARGDVASVTVSAAQALVERPAEEIAEVLWKDVAAALGLQAQAMPPARIVKEKRATFAQIPAALPLRPPARTRYGNLFLAGDWTATGLPATIEGAVRSGTRAARLARAALA